MSKTVTLIFQGRTDFENGLEREKFANEMCDFRVGFESLDDFSIDKNGRIEATIIFKNVAATEARKQMFVNGLDRMFKEFGKTYTGKVKMFVMEEK